MHLEKVLDKWAKAKVNYISKFYLIKNQKDKKKIELFYKYERDEEVIDGKVNFGIDSDYNIPKDELFGYLDNCNSKFDKLLAQHIEDNWEQEIFSETPSSLDAFDVAFLSPHIENTEEKNNQNAKVTITDGIRKGDNILSKEESVNEKLNNGEIKIIGWCHK